MTTAKPQYLSVSRRTDIPCFFYEQFFAAWQVGAITYDAGYGRYYTVSLRTDDVLGYIFWSKDFAPFIAQPLFQNLIKTNNAIFHFTINDGPDLEPNVPPLDKRLETLGRLCDLVGPERVLWRFDPICKYQLPNGTVRTNHETFYRILPHVSQLGISRCYFSFMTLYAKLKGRACRFYPFSAQERIEISQEMVSAAHQAHMTLHNCCNKELLELVPEINQAHCVDADLLAQTDRFGVHQHLKNKPTRPGCGCFESRDIGSYLQKCSHSCHYCYANPAE